MPWRENKGVCQFRRNLYGCFWGCLRQEIFGGNLNEYGHIEIYDQSNTLIAELNNKGLKLHSENGLKINGKTIFDMVYPVGAIYISINEASPSVLFGGTWEQIQGGLSIGTQTAYAWKRVD